jgi:hypothetical protein
VFEIEAWGNRTTRFMSLRSCLCEARLSTDTASRCFNLSNRVPQISSVVNSIIGLTFGISHFYISSNAIILERYQSHKQLISAIMYSATPFGAARITRKSAHFSPAFREPLILGSTPALRGDVSTAYLILNLQSLICACSRAN